jgi:hypothetical protein
MSMITPLAAFCGTPSCMRLVQVRAGLVQLGYACAPWLWASQGGMNWLCWLLLCCLRCFLTNAGAPAVGVPITVVPFCQLALSSVQ